ncbi:MAG TPA: lasso peptide biosynthesis B2 protein [Pseudolabrys sp.]|nr:lasso peptide biosynthesis B2 protein [Pseudolabrys sp.]
MARRRSLRSRLRRFADVGGHRRVLLAEAALLLLAARAALKLLPFPKLAKRLGTAVAPGDMRLRAAHAQADARDVEIAREIGWAVTRASRHVPFDAVCLPQAIAARMMLKRRGVASVLHFGARAGRDRPLEAHAWLDAAGVEVTGYPVAESLAEVACFI